MTGHDGKVGALLVHRSSSSAQQQWVVTSPNADYVPRPEFGSSSIQLRADLRYGIDDATIWPQPISKTYPYLSVIRRRPSNPSDPLSVLWWTPTLSHFTPANNCAVFGLGNFKRSYLDPLYTLVKSLRSDTSEFIKNKDAIGLLNVESSLSIMVLSWVRLEGMPATFEEKALELTEFQRNWLELRATLDYHSVYHMQRVRNTEPSVLRDDFIGGFTAHDNIAHEMFMAGIPVWLVRPATKIATGIRVDSWVSPVLPDALVEMRPHFNQYPVIFRGPATDPGRYVAQHKFTRARMVWVDPWGHSVPPDDAPADPHLKPGQSYSLQSRNTSLPIIPHISAPTPSTAMYSLPASSTTSLSSATSSSRTSSASHPCKYNIFLLHFSWAYKFYKIVPHRVRTCMIGINSSRSSTPTHLLSSLVGKTGCKRLSSLTHMSPGRSSIASPTPAYSNR